MIQEIIIMILIPIWVYSWAIIDASHYNINQWVVNHNSRWVNRCLVGLMVATINPLLGVYTALVFWALFDGLLSFKRDLPFYYIGGQAESDKFFKNNQTFYKASKHISFLGIIAIASIIIKQFL